MTELKCRLWGNLRYSRELSSVLRDDLDGRDGGSEVQAGGAYRYVMAESLRCTAEASTAV